MIIKKHYIDEPVNLHMKSLINITRENNRVITTKKHKGKLPLFCVNVEGKISIHTLVYMLCAYSDIHIIIA